MIAIVKYNAGNIRSVLNAVQRLGYECIITDSPAKIRTACKVILPGVGEAASAMRHLRRYGIDRTIITLRQPVLGICLGLQLLCRYSEEGDTKCLGIYNSTVKKLPPVGKVPHMGWNNVTRLSGPLFRDVREGEDVYYVHSYYTDVNELTTAETEYLVPFSAAMQKDNFYSVQFHPEKSASAGQQIIKNFLEL